MFHGVPAGVHLYDLQINVKQRRKFMQIMTNVSSPLWPCKQVENQGGLHCWRGVDMSLSLIVIFESRAIGLGM